MKLSYDIQRLDKKEIKRNGPITDVNAEEAEKHKNLKREIFKLAYHNLKTLKVKLIAHRESEMFTACL